MNRASMPKQIMTLGGKKPSPKKPPKRSGRVRKK